MKKSLFKVVSLITVLALMLMAAPIQSAFAAGEPAAPSQIDIGVIRPGDLSISFFWSDNSFDETNFEIERCIGLGCTDFVLIATHDTNIWAPWFVDLGLAENTTYSYRIRAVNAAGASAYTDVASATTGYGQLNGQVSRIAGAFTNGAVELTWTEYATNETRYEIERYEIGAGGPGFIVIGTVAPDTTSYIDTTVLQGATYMYRAVPWRFDIRGGAPEVVVVEAGIGIAAPTSVNATDTSKTSVHIKWKGKFAAGTKVVVQRQDCDAYFNCTGWITVGQVAASTKEFTERGLTRGRTYTYQLRAVTATSVSPFVTIYATTKP